MWEDPSHPEIKRIYIRKMCLRHTKTKPHYNKAIVFANIPRKQFLGLRNKKQSPDRGKKCCNSTVFQSYIRLRLRSHSAVILPQKNMAAVDGERLNEGKPELVRQIKTARCCRSVCVCADEYAPQQLKEEAEREASPRIHARPDTFH